MEVATDGKRGKVREMFHLVDNIKFKDTSQTKFRRQ